jgi:hypothetical protein
MSEPNYGRLAGDLGQRIKAMLSPLEDVCRYRERRSEDHAEFDVKPRNASAIAFRVSVAAGGVNIETPYFTIHELPVAESPLAEAFVSAFLDGRVRRVLRLSAGGRLLGAKTFVFDGERKLLYKHRSQAGMLAMFTRTARHGRERFEGYRGG